MDSFQYGMPVINVDASHLRNKFSQNANVPSVERWATTTGQVAMHGPVKKKRELSEDYLHCSRRRVTTTKYNQMKRNNHLVKGGINIDCRVYHNEQGGASGRRPTFD
jgi:hypothetical protein